MAKIDSLAESVSTNTTDIADIKTEIDDNTNAVVSRNWFCADMTYVDFKYAIDGSGNVSLSTVNNPSGGNVSYSSTGRVQIIAVDNYPYLMYAKVMEYYNVATQYCTYFATALCCDYAYNPTSFTIDNGIMVLCGGNVAAYTSEYPSAYCPIMIPMTNENPYFYNAYCVIRAFFGKEQS